MKKLLETWSRLEPHLCKRETNHEEFESYYVTMPEGQWLVYSDIYPTALMRIQWAVHQAIVQKGWHLEMYYTPATYNEAIVIIPSKTRTKVYSQNSMAEALLAAYLEALEDVQ